MEFKVGILSKDTIKPSSPTPQSLRKYTLSYLDQLAPPTFIPHIYFYKSNTTVSYSEKSNELKNSLSRVLTKFYPLAGRLVDYRYVDCNDEGAPYIEAEADCDLIQVIRDPKPLDMNKFIPYQVEDIKNINMAVQVTFFECGSMAIGLMVSHVLADAQSSFHFAKSWADATRLGNTTSIPSPKFEFASIFPPHVLPRVKPNITDSIKEELVTKLFKFSSSKISTLRDTYASLDIRSTTPRPSRVVALSSFIFARFISATELNPNQNKTFVVVVFANLRSRFKLPLSEDYFGNMSDGATAMPSMGDSGHEIAQKVTEAVRTVNEKFMAKMKEREKHLNVTEDKKSEVIKGEVVAVSFSSFCSYPVYEEADFGWGKPAWIGSVPLPYKNLVTFIDSSGDGIEAWIVLEKEDMKKFEADLELQAFLHNRRSNFIKNILYNS